MKSISFKHAAEHLDDVMDDVVATGKPVLVRRRKRGAVVIVSKADYTSMEETLYLLSSPANALRLLGAVNDIANRNHLVGRDLID